jgi:hypothetical protein
MVNLMSWFKHYFRFTQSAVIPKEITINRSFTMVSYMYYKAVFTANSTSSNSSLAQMLEYHYIISLYII